MTRVVVEADHSFVAPFSGKGSGLYPCALFCQFQSSGPRDLERPMVLGLCER